MENIVDLRINETLQTGAVRKPNLPVSCLVGTVSNCADAVRLKTAPTGGERVYLFLEFTINYHLTSLTVADCGIFKLKNRIW